MLTQPTVIFQLCISSHYLITCFTLSVISLCEALYISLCVAWWKFRKKWLHISDLSRPLFFCGISKTDYVFSVFFHLGLLSFCFQVHAKFTCMCLRCRTADVDTGGPLSTGRFPPLKRWHTSNSHLQWSQMDLIYTQSQTSRRQQRSDTEKCLL